MWWNFLVLVGGLASGAAYRLPGDVRPVHYDLAALYDLDPSTNFSYFAVVQILLTVVKPTSKIMLHAQDLLIDHRDISLKGYPISHVNLTKPSNLITIIMDTTLEENRNYTLTIPFYGHLDTGLRGVYISNYDDMMTKSKEYLVATQFEPISARKGFPCFDEPMYKATFRITLGHSRNYTAVSNMPLNKTSEDNAVEAYWPWSTVSQTFRKSQSDFVWDEFERSVPMSTYLVAFVISKFRNVESPAGQSTTKFRIWCRGDAIEQLVIGSEESFNNSILIPIVWPPTKNSTIRSKHFDNKYFIHRKHRRLLMKDTIPTLFVPTSYAASVGPRVLDHFEKFFSIPFPLPKLDMFAIPDFSTGAMENWGLITYRETALLYDKQQSSFLNKDTVASVIAHELAHQWFGNLVTMKWWSDLWLNEGFATFMGSVGVAAVEPTWEADKVSAIDRMKNIYSIDSLESSHPVSVPLEDPNRIHEIFDRITYSKSAALVRMMTMFLGEDVFREAMHNYLLKYSYQNAEQDDLWAELTAVSQQHGGLSRDVTVKQVMDTWTTQAGYPLLTVTRDYTAKSLTIQQKRYLSLSTARSTSSWWVPLNVLCQSEALASARALQWLGKHEGVSALHRFEHGSGPDEWVLFNYDIIALCHVNYDKRNWELLSNTLTSEKYTSVPVLGRVQLLGDGFALAWSNQLDYTIVLQLASYLHRERDYLPVSTCLDALAKIEEMIKRTSDYGAFQKYVRSLIADMYHDAGGLAAKKILDVDNLIKVKMQVMTSEWACRMHVPSCENNAIDMFRSWMDQTNPDENNPIPLDLRPTVYCVSLSHGSVREWRFALERMQRANVAAAREQLLHALACTREVWLLSQFLEWAITEGSVVRRQDAHIVIVFITRSSVGYYVAKDFIYNRIADLHNTFKYGHGAQLGGIADMLTEQFTSQKELDEFQLWYANNTRFFEGAKLTVQQAIEKASDNIGWVERNRRQVVDKLREFSTSDDKLPIMRTMADQGEKMSACVALILVNVLITLPLC